MRNPLIMLFLAVAALVFSGVAVANEGHDHQHGAALTSSAHADVKEFPDCMQCGMDRNVFAHSRMLITYADGTKSGICSLACAVTVQKKNPGKNIGSIKVADYHTKELIDAEKAVWVIGGKKPGVMTAIAKWAFGTRKDGEKFTRANGGKIATFAESRKMAEGEK